MVMSEFSRLIRYAAAAAVGLTIVVAATLPGCGGEAGSRIAAPSGAVSVPAQSVCVLGIDGLQTGRTVSTPALTAGPGTDFDLQVSVDDRSAIAGLQLSLIFDKTVLTCTDIVNGDIIGNPLWTPGGGAPLVVTNVLNDEGRANIAVVSAFGADPGSGVLVVFRMQVAANAAVSSTSIAVSGSFRDSELRAIGDVNFASSPIAIGQQGLIGDLMGTGLPEIGSAMRILRVVVQMDPPPAQGELWKWDCDSSGAGSPVVADVGIADAIKVLRCVVGLDLWPIGGGGGAASSVAVSVDPSVIDVVAGQQWQFTALVSGTADTRVTWLVDGAGLGTVSSTGLYTAPILQEDADVTIKAISQAAKANGSFGAAQVHVARAVSNGGNIIVGISSAR